MTTPMDALYNRLLSGVRVFCIIEPRTALSGVAGTGTCAVALAPPTGMAPLPVFDSADAARCAMLSLRGATSGGAPVAGVGGTRCATRC